MGRDCRMLRWSRCGWRRGMPTGDGRLGELRVATYGRGIWQIPLLTAATSGAAGDDVECYGV